MAIGNDTSYHDADRVCFYIGKFDVLDNYSANIIEYESLKFYTTEHYYHWNKFTDVDTELAEVIRLARSPAEAHRLARVHRDRIPADWDHRKLDVMRSGIAMKLGQHPDVRAVLKLTGDRRLIENSSDDLFWGIGRSGHGENWMGRLWMELRAGTLFSARRGAPASAPACLT